MEHKHLYKQIEHCQGLSTNSKTILHGECFFALKGLKFDASTFIDEALSKGAAYAITDNPNIHHPQVLYTQNTLESLAYCAKEFYTNLPKCRIAITGTNGKTSTADYCRQIFELCGYKAASIGTIGISSSSDIPANLHEFTGLTSNDLISNYKILSGLKNCGIDYASLEVSSIGLDQKRFDNMKFSAAAFTNFSPDHLDYHGSIENYLESKLILFHKNLNDDAAIFISQDVAAQIKQSLNKNCKIIGYDQSCDIYINSIKSNLDGLELTFSYKNNSFTFFSKIIGKFQAENLLFAIMLAHHHGLEISEIIKIIPKILPVKGRLQKVDDSIKNRYIFIDYAHNPDALKKVILELKAIKKPNTKLFTLFGCGGARDKIKRPIMGKYASELSDTVIITDDNPRNELPEDIRSAIIRGIGTSNYIEIPERKKAIQYALNQMQEHDILLIAGKGHEEYQIYGSQKKFFSDVKTVESFLTQNNK